ncbi:hypothetical protein EMA8858_01615 [Emticicia aquatica]|jgi:hypothetical protein|uniref:Uncharacterized protein n=1 Tax=Emticicia aquatica TaxID=1681835 RepID=A0ABN8ERI3_9BACT|nr:hypothetical protein [Emticicia aquatica]CAH0995492.1 hypothetical protein EMA8858_01615 [Emticicia aquatica]
MATSKIQQLTHAYFEHKIWRNELELARQEASFFLKILDEYKVKTLSQPHNSLVVAEFVNQFHHFQRLVKRLLLEMQGIDKEMAQGVISDNIFDKDQKKDHLYFNDEMKYFETDYRETKYRFRRFIASFENPVTLN